MDKVYIVLGNDSEDDSAWVQGVYTTWDKARTEFERKIKEECFYLGLVKTDEYIEIDDEDYEKFWENNSLDDVFGEIEGKYAYIDSDDCMITTEYGRTVCYQILCETIDYEDSI